MDVDVTQNPESGLIRCLKLTHKTFSSTLYSEKLLTTEGVECYDDLGCCHLPHREMKNVGIP